MSGNVSEWCGDWFPGYEGSYRVMRNGGWSLLGEYCAVAYSRSSNPVYQYENVGFRVALSSVP